MTANVNSFVERINRSILVGLFGKKPPISKNDKSYPEADWSRYTAIEQNIDERRLQGRYYLQLSYV